MLSLNFTTLSWDLHNVCVWIPFFLWMRKELLSWYRNEPHLSWILSNDPASTHAVLMYYMQTLLLVLLFKPFPK